MMQLVIDEHHHDGRAVCEIHDDEGGLVGVIYPTSHGVKLVSKYLGVREDQLVIDPAQPPALLVNLK
jgi:hypothetical protein